MRQVNNIGAMNLLQPMRRRRQFTEFDQALTIRRDMFRAISDMSAEIKRSVRRQTDASLTGCCT